MIQKATDEYASIPRDFPRADLVDEVLSNYRLCQELVGDVVKMVRGEQLRSPLIATPEIVGTYFETALCYGWGCHPGEVEWIFRNVVRELGCDLPEQLTKQHCR